MAKFLIRGGKPLKGKVRVFGCKNAALPILAATVLTSESCIIENIPEIADVWTMVGILKKLGAEIERIKPHVVKVQVREVKDPELDPDLVRKLRASILLMGPLLARTGRMKMLHPGGCIIGRRPVGTHFEALEAMGAQISQDQENYYAKNPNKHLRPAKIFLDEPSVTATENTIMAASLTPGKTVIKFAATEPHVVDLCQFLVKMGAEIKGISTQTLEITGVKELKGVRHKLVPDNIEAGTFAAAAAATGGRLTISGVKLADLDPILHKLKDMNVKFETRKDELIIKPSPALKATRIQTNPWPGFPTDLQPPFCVLATQAKGTSLIHDWMYERRLFYIDELIKMGANIILCDPHRALVTGPTKLYGAQIASPDIRAGIALVIAGLVAKGTTEIDNIQLIDRGYEKIEERFAQLGAQIERVK